MENQTTITMTQMSGKQVEIVTQVDGALDIRALTDFRAAELAKLIAVFLVKHGS
jgi:hypothetical protein